MDERTSSAEGQATATLAEAHQRLLLDKSLQFQLEQATPPKPPPNWLVELLERLAPILKVVFWGGVVVVGALIVAFLLREILRTRWKRRSKVGQAVAPASWRPKAGRARLLLDEADRLAAQGLFAEAAHHLLLHSIQDVEDHRPRSIRPALTSRDIAAMEVLPPQARAAFGQIAQAVERNLFGGSALDAQGFAECRRAYEAFAFEGAWS